MFRGRAVTTDFTFDLIAAQAAALALRQAERIFNVLRKCFFIVVFSQNLMTPESLTDPVIYVLIKYMPTI